MIDPTRYLLRALEVVLYALACSGFLYLLGRTPRAHQPVTLLEVMGLLCLVGLVWMVGRESR